MEGDGSHLFPGRRGGFLSYAQEILRLHAAGLRNFDIAQQVGCAQNTVNWHLTTRGLAPNRDACIRSHPYTPENTRIAKDGSRICRECHRLANREANGWNERPPRTDFDHDFFGRNEPVSAWLAGLLAADGCVQGHRVWKLALSGNAGRELVRDVANLVGHRGKVMVKKTVNLDSHGIHISSSRHVKDLAKQWCVTPRKSLTLQWPAAMPTELAAPFLRGYSDGDGHVGKTTNGGARFCLIGTPEFIAAAREALPVDGGSLRRNGPRTTTLTLTYRKARMALSWLYADPALPQSTKYTKAMELVA